MQEDYPGEPVFVAVSADNSVGAAALPWVRRIAETCTGASEPLPWPWIELYIGGLPEPGLHRCTLTVTEDRGGEGRHLQFHAASGCSLLYQCRL